MHQPFYKNLWTGEYKLPWTRLHALKDYGGMVEILAEFPHIRQTFNLVPSMLAQIEDYAGGQASDPFFDCAVLPAEDLTAAQRAFAARSSRGLLVVAQRSGHLVTENRPDLVVATVKQMLDEVRATL